MARSCRGPLAPLSRSTLPLPRRPSACSRPSPPSGRATGARRGRAGLTLNYTDAQGTCRLRTTLGGVWTREGSAVLGQGVEGGIVTGGVGLVGGVGYGAGATVRDAGRITCGGGVVLGRLA